MYEKLIWALKQLFPLTYRTIYSSEGKVYYHTWKMWLGRCYAQEWVTVDRAEAVSKSLTDAASFLFGVNPEKEGIWTMGDSLRFARHASPTSQHQARRRVAKQSRRRAEEGDMDLIYDDSWSDNRVGHMTQDIEWHDGGRLADWMRMGAGPFGLRWDKARRAGYTTEETASMAADGFEVSP